MFRRQNAVSGAAAGENAAQTARFRAPRFIFRAREAIRSGMYEGRRGTRPPAGGQPPVNWRRQLPVSRRHRQHPSSGLPALCSSASLPQLCNHDLYCLLKANSARRLQQEGHASEGQEERCRTGAPRERRRTAAGLPAASCCNGMGAESEGNASKHGREAVEGMRRRSRGAGIGGRWRCTAAGPATAEGAHGALQPPAAGKPVFLQYYGSLSVSEG